MSQVVDKKDLIAVRPGVEDDKAFIMSTWLKGLRYGNDWFELIEATAYYQKYHEAIERLLYFPDTEVKVACLKDSPDVILGYSVHTKDRFHWIFVKKSWRGIGIAKSLVPDGIASVTHLTDTGRQLLKKYPKIVFNPFI